jgi:hypothetical protein
MDGNVNFGWVFLLLLAIVFIAIICLCCGQYRLGLALVVIFTIVAIVGFLWLQLDSIQGFFGYCRRLMDNLGQSTVEEFSWSPKDRVLVEARRQPFENYRTRSRR